MQFRILASIGLSCAWLLFTAGAAANAQITDTEADFSNSAQGVNGYQYGVYSSGYGTTGTFSTATLSQSGSGWRGTDVGGTPYIGQYESDPGASTNDPAVRRYTIGTGGQPDYTGEVEITGDFYASNPSETTSGFITVNGVNLFSQPVAETGDTNFDVFADVSPGSTIDFGLNDDGTNGFSDSTDMEATVTEVPEPVGGMMIGTAGLLFLASRFRQRNGVIPIGSVTTATRNGTA
jgi:hypothetical protein